MFLFEIPYFITIFGINNLIFKKYSESFFMEGFTGAYTTNRLPIYTLESVNRQRTLFRQKKATDYIAQQGGQENAVRMDADIIITGGNRGGGKANTYDTPVIVPSGIVTMGELAVGDPICTPYDGIQTVQAIFEQGEQTVYKVTFDDGTTSKVMREHRFLARNTRFGEYKVMTLGKIMRRYRLGQDEPNGLLGDYKTYTEIPFTGETDFQEYKKPYLMPVHPYMLGAFTALGSAIFKGTGIVLPHYCGRTMDILRAMGLKYKKNEETGEYIYSGLTYDQRRYFQQRHGNFNNDFRIPNEYLTASKETRWELLHGIMDVGCSYIKKKPAVKSKNKKYLDDLMWLARSLGIWCKLHHLHENTFYVDFRADDNIKLFLSPSKAMWAKEETRKKYPVTKKIVSIHPCEQKEKCRCIQVSGKDHLYLTDAFTINHNTVMLLMGGAYFFGNPMFSGIVLRKEKGDLDNIIKESNYMYYTCGEYKASYMRWDMRSGAQLLFSYYTGSYEDFKDRMQGRQYSYIGIDEITQMGFDKFKYLITSNRNGAHIRNRIIGTCNPDPTSWVAKFIDWWIGDDGYPIPERNGQIRYCFMGGESPQDIVWGSTRKEVYLKIKDKIDELADERDALPPEEMYIKSVVFVRAELDDNRALLDSSPEYKANLAQQSDEQRERDFKGNWKFMSVGNDLIKMTHLQRCFENPQMLGNNVRYASLDVAFEGGDACVMWLWIGWHVADIFVCRMNSKDTVRVVQAKLDEWRVSEEHLVYDMQGVGQVIKGFFRKAKPFNNQEAVGPKDKGLYDTVKSKCAFTFADKIIQGEISFEPSILTRKFSGKGFKNLELYEILMQERKIIRADDKKEDKGKCLIQKDVMKKIIHRSPDFMESLFMRMAFEKDKSQANVPEWLLNSRKRNHRIQIRKLC